MKNMKFHVPDEFLKTETRLGYVVTKKEKKHWAVELYFFAELERVCKKINPDIPYTQYKVNEIN